MTEIQTSGKRNSPRVDLTAMVDLGFLLITFFMLVTTYASLKIMKVSKPEESTDPGGYIESKTLTVLLGEREKVYWYVGADDDANLQFDSTDFSNKGIRERILIRQEEVLQKWGSKDKLIVILKSMPGAKYSSFVNILDEMEITGTKHFVIDELNFQDSMIIKKVGMRLSTEPGISGVF